jgi:hypothetical protein
MKLWIDDVRPAPEGYLWFKSTNEALRHIRCFYTEIDTIDLDHDAGDYADMGGDYINVLKELERLSKNTRWAPYYKTIIAGYKFRLHSANPVGVANMRAIIEANGWKEIK